MHINKETDKAYITSKIKSYVNKDLSLSNEVIKAIEALNTHCDTPTLLFNTWSDAYKYLISLLDEESIKDSYDLVSFMVGYNIVMIYNIGTGFVVRYNFLPLLQMHRYIITDTESIDKN